MRRLALLAVLLLGLAACTPALAPTVTAGRVTLAPTADVYAVTLHVLDAATIDERCTDLTGDVACILGDIQAGQVVVVEVTGAITACSAFGFTDPAQSIRSYRPFPCHRELR